VTPIKHPSNNLTLNPAPGDEGRVIPLHVTRDEHGVRSYWQLSEAEIASVLAGQPVEFFCASTSHPPIWIGVEGVPA
jgi:hypothetical protein